MRIKCNNIKCIVKACETLEKARDLAKPAYGIIACIKKHDNFLSYVFQTNLFSQKIFFSFIQ